MFPLLSRFLKNSNLVFFAAFVLGLLFGDPASSLMDFMMPALVFIMSLSTTQITLHELAGIRNYLRDIVSAFLINYLFLSGLILSASHVLVADPDLYAGFVIMAAIPPAVAVLPFTYLLGGRMIVSLLGTASLYLASLIMAPVISFAFLDTARLDMTKLASALIQLILVPFVLSRVLLRWPAFRRIQPHTDVFVNSAFFLIIYGVIGMNRSSFLGRFEILLLVSLIAFIRTFVSGHFIDLVCRVSGIDRERRMSYVLFGSFKNLGLSATMALVLFNERAAVPSAVTIPFEILFFIWFNYFRKRWG
jgi:BASS family bile acid:Na+ symporter